MEEAQSEDGPAPGRAHDQRLEVEVSMVLPLQTPCLSERRDWPTAKPSSDHYCLPAARQRRSNHCAGRAFIQRSSTSSTAGGPPVESGGPSMNHKSCRDCERRQAGCGQTHERNGNRSRHNDGSRHSDSTPCSSKSCRESGRLVRWPQPALDPASGAAGLDRIGMNRRNQAIGLP